MKEEIKKALKQILLEMKVLDIEPVVETPKVISHGDYTTNIGMVLAKRLKHNPIDITEEIVLKLKSQMSNVKSEGLNHSTYQSDHKISGWIKQKNVLQDIAEIKVIPPGFINFFLTASTLSKQLSKALENKESFGTIKSASRKKIIVEFAHPNTHKAFHIGHLRNITTGESLIRLLESQGNEVIRVNYQGDVGMHIAKALYALLRISNIKHQISKIKSEDIKIKVKFLGEAYAAGSKAFEEDKAAQEEIKDINYLIYAAVQRFNKERKTEPSSTDYMKFVHERGVEVDEIYELWKETRQWSLEYFDSIYQRVGTTYQRLYFESECLSGVDEAKEAVKQGILEENEGAIIFNGKKYGLDTRVFVNSLGLPTYEAKELALSKMEFSEFGILDKAIHVVGPEQASFFKVTFKVEELLGIQKDQQLHLVYGWVKLKHGKMSSRSGNVVLGEWLIDEAKKAIYSILEKSASKYTKEQQEEIAEKAAIAAVKYSFLKVSTTQEIAFDLAESINFQGDSGPYLQYTYARAKSVLRKSQISNLKSQIPNFKFNEEELLVMRLLYKFPEIVAEAAKNYSPNALCKYLYDLASIFNTFYNKHQILSSQLEVGSSQFRLGLTKATAQVLKKGLYLLGIETLERM